MATIENLYVGDGTTVLYSFTFPYIEEDDIKVSLDAVITTAYSLANATTVEFVTAPANGVAIRIYRDTSVDDPKAVFYPGSAIRAQDLNDNFEQNLFVIQEADFNNQQSATDSAAALTIAQAADAKADQANVQSAAAEASAAQAQTDATQAAADAASAQVDASNAAADASAAQISADQANLAVQSANIFTPIPNVAAIPASPADQDRVSVLDSTGIGSFTPLTGLPVGPIYDSGAYVNIVYQATGATWAFVAYGSNDPDARYLLDQAGTVTPVNLDRTYVEAAGDTLTGNLTVPSLNDGPLAGFRNLLINGNAVVAQRTTASGAAVSNSRVYGLFDRWVVGVSAGGNWGTAYSSRDNRNAMLFNVSSVATFSVGQVVDYRSAWQLGGKVVTLSGWVKAASAFNATIGLEWFDSAASGVIPGAGAGVTATLPVTTSWTYFSQSFTVPTTPPLASYKISWGLSVGFSDLSANASFEIQEIQLEPGPVATPFEYRPIGTELALCQRYYEKTVAGNYGTAGPGSNGYAGSTFNYSVAKRTIPTITSGNILNSNIFQTGNVEFNSRTVSGGIFVTRWALPNILYSEYRYIIADAEL